MVVKNPAELVLMKKAGEITKKALDLAKSLIKPNISTLELDKSLKEYIIKCGATPSFLHYQGYPASICASLNDVVVHGIPSKDVVLKEGDIISIDVGACYKGYHGDAARTFPVGKISPEKERLIKVTEECFFVGIEKLRVGGRLGELSSAIQQHAEKNGYSVVRELVGHGIGRQMHEYPSVPNYGHIDDGPKLAENICLAVEPMINMGKKDIFMERDGWTIRTKDGLPSAHYENTILLTKNGVEILTI